VSDQLKHIEFELVQRAQNGDHKAFEELVVLHDRQVLNVAYSMTGSLADAQDIYQETFLRAFRAIGSFRFQSSFRTWVLRIAVNQAINWRKKKKLRSFFSLDAHDQNSKDSQFLQIAGTSDASTSLHSKEILEHIQNGMNRLSNRERAVFTLRHFQEIKIKEIAALLDCAEGTVKNLLFRATQKMQKELQEFVED
jgi:RNA polymerase sigma-70 factor (ECF subfamily)